MSEDRKYNGCTNYETWNVALWLDNEEGSYRYWNDRAQELYDDDHDEDEATRNLADELKSEHEENTPTVTGVYADLLNAALNEVNWYEIAEHYIDEVDKVEEKEEEVIE